MPSVQTLVRDVDLYLSLGPWFLPMVKFGQAKPDGLGHIDTVDSDLMHHQYRLCSSVERRPSAQESHQYHRSDLRKVPCRSFFKKPVIMFPTSPISSLRTLATRTSPSCSTRTRSSPTLWFLPFKEDSTSEGTWGMLLLIVRGLLRRPSLSGTPTVTFCSVHIHIFVAKQRDAFHSSSMGG